MSEIYDPYEADEVVEETKTEKKIRRAKEQQALVKKIERKQKQIVTLQKKIERAQKELDDLAEQL